MSPTAQAVQDVRQRIARAAAAVGRDPEEITLVAVSKAFSPESICAAHEAGIRHFGESYAQEAVEKISALAQQRDIQWHFIGPVQANKTRLVAQHFAWVHCVDRLKIAQRLSAQRSSSSTPLNICLQVNISAEPTKSGVAPEEVCRLARSLRALPRLNFRGLMGIAEPTADYARQRAQFHLLGQLFDELIDDGFSLDTLSMGMSDDLEAAIAEGATTIRVGRAIFGERVR